MQLYVVRHAIAEDAEPGQDDSDRALSKDGKRKLRAAVRGLRALDVRFDRVLTSPKLRAIQTATALAKLCAAPPLVTPLLAQSPRNELLAQVAELAAATKHGAAVVGHEPWLGELIALLAFGDTRFGESLALKKAGVALLDGSAVPGGMTIQALLPPKMLRTARG
jgi:phosphohistidine phosphatase|nr:histidine phosphatase family protein [Kofleriaceae bacterium]